jgi:TPR repeat protein
VLASVGIVLSAANSTLPAEPSGREVAVKLIGNVVQIRSKWAERPQAGGFGFIVGERSGLLYIVTANHVVRGDSPDEIDRAPGLVFEHRQGVSYPGRLLETSSTAVDLAVIAIETASISSDVKWVREAVSASEAVVGMEVWFVGLEREWRVPDRPAKISSATEKRRIHYSGKTITVGDLRVAVGTSGAPLIAKEGIVGMIVSDSSNHDVEAIPIERVEGLRKGWRHRWELTMITTHQNCDRYAASPYDANRPKDVIGVPIEKIELVAAMNACFDAAFWYGPKIPRFMFQLGRAHEAAERFELAESGYKRAVEKGYAAAQASLGVLYEQQNKDREAVELYRAAAAQGDPVAQTNLATMFRDGFGGLTKDDVAALGLYERAAAQGYAAALSGLAWMYEQGRGVARSEADAERLYSQAAAKGDAYAERALARLGQ